jgi:hypothetical protein
LTVESYNLKARESARKDEIEDGRFIEADLVAGRSH